MSVYGVDFLTNDDGIDFIIVDADSEEEARVNAGKHLNSLGLPKRNILRIEKYDWLDK